MTPLIHISVTVVNIAALSASGEEEIEGTQEHEENAYEKEKEDEKASIFRGPVEIPTGSDLHEEDNECTDSQAVVTDLGKTGDSKEAMNKEGMYGMFLFPFLAIVLTLGW